MPEQQLTPLPNVDLTAYMLWDGSKFLNTIPLTREEAERRSVTLRTAHIMLILGKVMDNDHD